MWRRGALSHHLLPRALSQGRARSHSPCLQLPSTVTKVRLCRAALHPGHLRASVHQGGATAEDTRTGGLAGNWQAVHCQLSEWVSSGLFPQLLEKKKKSEYTYCYWRRKWLPIPVPLPGEFHGQRSLAGCSPWGHKESDTTEPL